MTSPVLTRAAAAPVAVAGRCIHAASTALLCCDMQEKFRPHIAHFTDIVTVGARLIEGCKILNIPLLVTEQYIAGLGKTVPELDISHAKFVCDKTKFTMCAAQQLSDYITATDTLKSVILFGIESHVCIQQTALDLVSLGLEVYVIADGCSSRSMMDRMFALQRLRSAGCIVTTSESLLLQLVGDKNHEGFKQIQALIRTSAPTSGLLTASHI